MSTEEWIKKIIVYIYSGVLFSHEEEQSPVIGKKMDGTAPHHVRQSEPDSDKPCGSS